MKVYVLTSRCDTSLGTPAVSSEYQKVYDQMKSEYEEWKSNGSTEAFIDSMDAHVESTSGCYVEWEITECEVQ